MLDAAPAPGSATRNWITYHLGTAMGKEDPERGQAVVRLIIVPLFHIYMTTALYLEGVDSTLIWIFVVIILSYIPISFLLLLHIIRRPGHYPGRRLFAMLGDYGAMAFALSIGGMALLPVFATLLWVTVGNGMRYGSRYLLVATIMALGTIAIATMFNSDWQAEPYIVITLVLTLLIVPAYINGLQNALRQALTEAREASLAKSNFLAQASHDLRQPIHAISLFTACLRDANLEREEQQMVENIDRSLNSVAGLFRSLLDIATLDSGKVEPRPEPICVGNIISDVVNQYSEMAQWSDVDLLIVPSRQHVSADAELLSTMLQNIVSNALKYAPGKPVLIGCRRKNGRLTIEIHDQGPGIPSEHLSRVFDEFYQVRERGDRDIEGVGLGLPIVRRVGGLMGLTVQLLSRPGKGTSVIIEGLQPCDPPVRRSQPPQVASPSALAGLQVLLVEDDEDVLQATATLLQKWGCKVQAEAGIPDVMAAWDVVITDYDLGGKRTGADCIATIQQMLGHAIPAIIMTGHDEVRVREELGDEHIPILAKPVRPAELRSVLTTQIVANRG